jgi:hypothetical protein
MRGPKVGGESGTTGKTGRLEKSGIGGLAGWVLQRFASGTRRPPRLDVLERLTLAPRQSLALVEADGQRILVATSAEGTPCFYPLDEKRGREIARTRGASSVGQRTTVQRVSW